MRRNILSISNSILLLVFISVFFVSTAIAAPPDIVTLPEQARGKGVCSALKNPVAKEKVASAHGMTVTELEDTCNDESLWIDRGGRLYHVEPAVASDPAGGDGSGFQEPDAVYGPEEAFLLNSDPDASKTLYLDFDGSVISGTAWNSTTGIDPQTLPAFDLDGSPSTFNTTERNRIIAIWRRVKEDFAAFDVNVTTQEPHPDKITRSGSGDTEYGSWAAITRSFSPYNGGGVAYYSAFGNTSNYTKPAMVFFNRLGSGNAKYTAEAISHEFGHNLDLRHDGKSGDSDEYYDGHGSGETGWASIMGVGYYKNLSQWSKGEYSGATNTQDDYVAMANRGLVFRADDHGDSSGSATFLNQGTTFGTWGVIQSPDDVDFVSFNAGAGTLELDVSTLNSGPNLDILLKVYDASGTLIGQANPADFLDASVSISLPADGVYYASVEGVGKGDVTGTGYSEYGSIGQWTLVGMVSDPGGNAPPVAMAEADVLIGPGPLTVVFDSSKSEDSDGTIEEFYWDFDDGSFSTAANPTHTFSGAGTYTVTLRVTDNGGLQDVATVNITVENAPPVAIASADVTSGQAPLAVSFRGSDSYDPEGGSLSYSWNFGDGTSSSSSNPSHSYSSDGTFTATLTVTDSEGVTDSDSVTITVEPDPAPVLSVNMNSGNATAELSWQDNSNFETSFQVYVRTESGKGKNKSYSSWQLIGQTAANATSFNHGGLSEGVNYQWYVKAYSSSEFADSNIVTGKLGKSGGGGGKGGGKGRK